MKIKDTEGWAKCLENNQDPYGSGIIRYAEKWADLMEAEMDQGHSIKDVAKDTSHTADEEGITGFMYGAAVSILSHAWEHGEELRQWHNLDTQIKDEGVRANASGGVLNPAILSVV
jgi:hypothetical protein